MTLSFWRGRARPIMERLLRMAFEKGFTWELLDAALRVAYPFGPKAHHPYKCWLEERALCRRAFEAGTTIEAIVQQDRARTGRPAPVEADPNQIGMEL